MGSKATTEIRIAKKRMKVSGGSKKGRQHSVHERKYRMQMDRTSKNKEKARVNHLKTHPNDVKAKIDIKKARGL